MGGRSMLERGNELSLTEAVKLVSTKYWGDCCWEGLWQYRFNLQQGEPTDLWSSEASLAQFQSGCGNLISFPAHFSFSQPISHRISECAGSFARLHVQPWVNPYPVVSPAPPMSKSQPPSFCMPPSLPLGMLKVEDRGAGQG